MGTRGPDLRARLSASSQCGHGNKGIARAVFPCWSVPDSTARSFLPGSPGEALSAGWAESVWPSHDRTQGESQKLLGADLEGAARQPEQMPWVSPC